MKVCAAIGYAHRKGIIHRDLKPQNVMLGDYGETLLVDWGLAKPVGRTDEQRAEVGEFLQSLEDHDDVHRVWAAVK